MRSAALTFAVVGLLFVRLLIGLGFAFGVIYVAVHFISKFW